jgi:hypothetical protein
MKSVYLILDVLGNCFCFTRKIAVNFAQKVIRCLYCEPINTDIKYNLLGYWMVKYAVHVNTTAQQIIRFISDCYIISTTKSIFNVKHNLLLLTAPVVGRLEPVHFVDNGQDAFEISVFWRWNWRLIFRNVGDWRSVGNSRSTSVNFN